MSKKDRECMQIKRFAELLADFPKGEVIPTENPDFLVECDGSYVGIELTDLYWKSAAGVLPYQAGESIRQRVADMVRRELVNQRMPNMAVSLFFSHGFHFDKASAAPTASKVVALVREFLPAHGGRVELGVNNLWVRLPDGVDEMSICVLPEFTEIHVSAPETAFIPNVEADHIQSEINKKERRLLDYRNRAKVVWLIIIADHGSISSWFETHMNFPVTAYTSKYDRVFLFEWATGIIHELELAS